MINKLKRTLKKAVIHTIRAREQRAAAELATYLVRYNKDFSNTSVSSLTKAILSKREITLDQVNGL